MLTKLRSGLPLTISTGGTTLPQTEVGFNEIGVPSVPEHFGKPSVLWAVLWHGRRSVRAKAFTALNVVNRNNPSSLTLCPSYDVWPDYRRRIRPGDAICVAV